MSQHVFFYFVVLFLIRKGTRMSFFCQQDFCASVSFFLKNLKIGPVFTLNVDCRLLRVGLEKDPRHVEHIFVKMEAQNQVLRKSPP